MDSLLAAPPHFGSNWQRLRTVVWRRLDLPGMELCHLAQSEHGFLIAGQVINALQHTPRVVRYHVSCDPAWHTVRARVVVETGDAVDALELRREADGRWLRNDVELPHVRGLTDVDLGFTPATNTLPIRRLAPDVGEAEPVTAVWVRFPDLAVQRLEQSYTRVGELSYRYESGGGSFRALIAVDDVGLVTTYERLFERVGSS